MAARISPNSEVFLDTSYAITLMVPADQNRARALELADELEARKARLVTTRAILLELGNALAKPQHRQAGVQLLMEMESDSSLEILSVTDELYLQGLQLYAARKDKTWGLIDCLSFVVMKDRAMTQALTADVHFEQAGFIALLRCG